MTSSCIKVAPLGSNAIAPNFSWGTVFLPPSIVGNKTVLSISVFFAWPKLPLELAITEGVQTTSRSGSSAAAAPKGDGTCCSLFLKLCCCLKNFYEGGFNLAKWVFFFVCKTVSMRSMQNILRPGVFWPVEKLNSTLALHELLSSLLLGRGIPLTVLQQGSWWHQKQSKKTCYEHCSATAQAQK